MKNVRNDTAFIHSRKKREGRKERMDGRINGYERDKKREEKITMVQRIKGSKDQQKEGKHLQEVVDGGKKRMRETQSVLVFQHPFSSPLTILPTPRPNSQ